MVRVSNLKLAFIHPDLGIGGAERLVVDVASALAEQGVQVTFITNHFDKTHAFQELQDGDRFPVTVIGDWLPRSTFGVLRALWAYIRMLYLAIISTLRFSWTDPPHVFFVDQIPMAVPILKWTRKRVVYYCHHPDLLASPPGGFLKQLYRKPIDWLERYGTQQADVILVNSKYTEQIFHRTFPQIKRKLQILYPTIASAFLHDLSIANRKPIHQLAPEIQKERPGDVLFLSINRYHPAKQLELAIDAMAALKMRLTCDEWNRVHLIIAGGFDPQSSINSGYFRKLVELTHQKGLVVKIGFLKSPSDQLKADLLKSCDCLLYTPSNEHFGIVPLEAMAAGKPVIACDSGGPRETVEDEVTGFLCEPDAESMAACMARCVDKQRAEELGRNGFKRLTRLFSSEVFKKDCMNIVSQLYETKSGMSI